MKFLSLFFIEIRFFDTQNTFYLILKGLKNAFFMPFLRLSKCNEGRPLANDHLEGAYDGIGILEVG